MHLAAAVLLLLLAWPQASPFPAARIPVDVARIREDLQREGALRLDLDLPSSASTEGEQGTRFRVRVEQPTFRLPTFAETLIFPKTPVPPGGLYAYEIRELTTPDWVKGSAPFTNSEMAWVAATSVAAAYGMKGAAAAAGRAGEMIKEWQEEQARQEVRPDVEHARRLASSGAGGWLLYPVSREMNQRAPDRFRVRLDTTRGPIVIEVHRAWAPNGADRFYNLVRHGYYDDSRFFRVTAGKWAQFGIHGDPTIASLWRQATIPDDSPQQPNARGSVAFAFAVPNGRSTQVFINLQDNSATHDAQGFAPFGQVVEGMEVAAALNAEYGESAGGGIRAGRQDPLFAAGNAYLDSNFPRLDGIRRATIE